MTARTEKVASLLKREVSATLQRGLADPRMSGMVSITELKVTDDLKQAYISISVLPKEHEKKVLAALCDAVRYIQRETQKRISLRTMPRLDFRLDDGIKKQADVLAAIREAAQRTGLEDTDESKED